MAPQNMPPKKLNRAPEYGSRNTDWGIWPPREEDTIDFRTVDYCVDALKTRDPEKPLFLACGIFKPHSPFFAPPKYHERLPEVPLPPRRADDWSDLPAGAVQLLKNKKWFWQGMSKLDQRIPGSYAAFIRGYAACCDFADAQIGRVLDALDASPRRDKTIVVLWSDHGFHLGEKDHIEKFALWEKATRVPFIVVAPGVTKPGTRCESPVDLSVIYPTLLDLCGLPKDPKCDGGNIVSLLRDPESTWSKPALTTYGRGNHGVRSKRWRYIRYADGTEELYDHSVDPNEWANVAGDPKHASIIADHRRWLPKEEAKGVGNLDTRRLKRPTPKPRERASVDRSRGGTRPNVLLVVSEDNGPELGCYGDPFVRTPNLDALAADGIRFHNAYVPQAGCSQSRAAFLTGRYPHQNGQIGLATWKFRMYDESAPNLVRSLKKTGYRTGIIGKLHVNPKSAFPFDVHAIPTSNFARRRLRAYAEEAERFIASSEKPFFLSVNYPDPHRPFLRQVRGVPENPLDADDVEPLQYFGVDSPNLREQTASYYNCMSRLDTLVGELLAALGRTGKLEDTLIVYLGDHGADLLRGKRTSYEGGVRVPFIVSWAKRWKKPAVHRELVSTLDLMPTLLEICGASPVEELSGRSLIDLIEGREKSWRRYLFTEFHTHSAHNFYPQRTVRDERFKLIANLLPGEVNPGYDFTLERFFRDVAVVIAKAPEPIRSAYARMRQPSAFELYDLEKDPYEFRDLSEDPAHAEVLARLRSVLDDWRKRTNDPLLHAENLRRLKAEIDACFVDGKPQKQRLELSYPEFFFATSSTRNSNLPAPKIEPVPPGRR